jgi:hypothetical protein
LPTPISPVSSGGILNNGYTRSEGVTPTEQLLAGLCERSFLKLWSYPNPFKEDGDEFCDLLAVSENDVFIFFDREGQHFASKNDPYLNWTRWKKKVVEAQIRTANGAERYIRRADRSSSMQPAKSPSL